MDSNGPKTGAPGSISVVRAAIVLVVFVAATVILVAVGTRPSVSGTPSIATATTATTVPVHGRSTTTSTTAGHAGTTTTTTRGHHHATGTSTTTTTAPHSSVSVVVANATSTTGLAAHYTTVIGAMGYSMQAAANATSSESTSAVYYAPGQTSAAASIAASIGVKPTQVLPLSSSTPVAGTTGIDVVVVIGQDLASTATTNNS
jgi:hypothetical protein